MADSAPKQVEQRFPQLSENSGRGLQENAKKGEKPKGAPKDRSAKRTALNDTGLHILKGAVVYVLGSRAAVTATTDFTGPTTATLTVSLAEGQGPTEEEIAAIEAAANDTIKKDLEVKGFKMERKAAEEKYRAAPVNSTFIYDSFPVPAHVTELTLVEIPDWNVNCCPATHCARTGEVAALKLKKVSYKEKKKQVEFQFAVGPDAASAAPAAAAAAPTGKRASSSSASSSSSSGPAPLAAFAGWSPGSASPVQALSSVLQQESVDALRKSGVELTQAQLEAFQAALRPRLEHRINIFQSQAYTAGYSAVLQRPPTVYNVGF